MSRRLLNLFSIQTKPKITHANKVTLVRSGPEAFERLLHEIRNARSSIDLEYYIFRDDEHGTLIADELVKRVKDGLSVAVIYDYVGCFSNDHSFFDRLLAMGVHVVPFNPIKLFSNPFKWEKRDHRKLAIFDSTTAIVSGWNIGSEYFRETAESMRDVGVLIEGPCVRVLQKGFCDLFARLTKKRHVLRRQFRQRPAGDDEVWVIESGRDIRYRQVFNAYRLAIMAAKKMVWIENAYFVPPRKLKKALTNAAHRGVDMRIVLPDKIDVPVVKYASYNFFSSLLAAGIKIYERSELTLHSKIACIDDVWVTLGSTNLHKRSFEKNYELNIVVVSEKFGAEVKAFIAHDIVFSRAISREEWGMRSLIHRFKEKIAMIVSPFI